ncbi:MAG: hypothetical protein CMD03_00170 [Flavobacteriales bacterium]|nr:hypothetical protein [Flavobacteriales bacterium]
MKKLFFIFFILSSCVSMQEVNLYQTEIISTEGLNGFTSIDIFSSGGSDEIWGNSDNECNPFTFSALDASIDYTKYKKTNNSKLLQEDFDYKVDLPLVKVKDKKEVVKNSLHIKTEYPASCNWIGMGIGWDAWQGKDLSVVMQSAAIEFMARVDNESISSIPIVFILEDYTENQCYATASYLGIEGGVVSDKWTKVTIPLQTFSYNKDNIDLTNIKQLLLQCYGKIDIYIDDIKIVEYKHDFKKFSSNLTVYDTIMPVNIFIDDQKSVWGLNNIYCDNFSIKNDIKYSNGNYIDVVISEECDWKDFAISWNQWLYTDLSSSIYDIYLVFDLKINNLSNATVSFEDYNGKKMGVDFSEYVQKSDYSDWNNVKIPMKKFPIRSSKIDLKKIKSIIFSFAEDSKLKIDNIKLIN